MEPKIIKKQKHSEFNTEVIPQLNSLKSYALSMTKDLANSEDLIQDTLMNAFRFFHKFEKGSNIKAWLFKIMQNTFINNYRKKVKQPSQINYDDVLNFYEVIKSDDVISGKHQEDALSNTLDDEVFNALSILPDDFRTIVFLSDIEGYTYQEISEFVDCPIGTVRSRLHRTRKILYASLFNYARNKSYLREKRSLKSKKEYEMRAQ